MKKVKEKTEVERLNALLRIAESVIKDHEKHIKGMQKFAMNLKQIIAEIKKKK